MAALTGVLYALLAVYLGGWYIGRWSGNFALLLFILTAVTFVYWLAERFVFAPRRLQAAHAVAAARAERQTALERQGLVGDGVVVASPATATTATATPPTTAVAPVHPPQPWWLDWTAGLFPVILMVFVLRSFLFEPFKIPSGSMIPTLLVGDLILVNKFHYGIRLPVLNRKIIPIDDPARGDVMVFRYPKDPEVDYIKRVVGLPGDEVEWRSQQLYVNGQLAPTQPLPDYYDEDAIRYTPQWREQLGKVEHRMLVDRNRPSYLPANLTYPFRDNCRYIPEGVVCKVPPGHYFMMGDNRDNSQDSRYWGFVPDENIVGKAFFVWMNFGDLKRIGPFR